MKDRQAKFIGWSLILGFIGSILLAMIGLGKSDIALVASFVWFGNGVLLAILFKG